MKQQQPGEQEFDAADAAGQAEALLAMADRLMAGTFSAAFGLGPEDQAQMVEALYAQVGRLRAGILRARAQAV